VEIKVMFSSSEGLAESLPYGHNEDIQ